MPTKDENPNVGAPEGNDHAEGNPGGGAPELNLNAATAHGMWGDWQKVYERLPLDSKAYIERLTESTVVRTKPYTPDLTPEERDALAREYHVLSRIKNTVEYDIFGGIGEDAPDDARGVYLKEAVEIDGETYQVDKPNPAFDRQGQIRARRREIEEKLNYYAHCHDDTRPWELDK